MPRYLGGSRERGFVLMEDVGAAGDLADTLVSGSAKTAGEQLLAMADLLAELHGRAAGREAEYERLWRERASH